MGGCTAFKAVVLLACYRHFRLKEYTKARTYGPNQTQNHRVRRPHFETQHSPHIMLRSLNTRVAIVHIRPADVSRQKRTTLLYPDLQGLEHSRIVSPNMAFHLSTAVKTLGFPPGVTSGMVSPETKVVAVA